MCRRNDRGTLALHWSQWSERMASQSLSRNVSISSSQKVHTRVMLYFMGMSNSSCTINCLESGCLRKCLCPAGLRSEGLYRVSGKKEDCLALQEKFDEGLLQSTRGVLSLGS